MKHKSDAPITPCAEHGLGGDGVLEHNAWDLCDVVSQRLTQRRKVLVAFSGGLDSTVLLDTLARLRQSRMSELALRAIYIHHGLNAKADAWAGHCQRQCELRQVDYQMLKVSLDGAPGGIEAAARSVRYHALQRALLPGETLLTAQHLDDQSETLLLALKRGSGPAGLSSMAASSRCGQHELLRPLLGVSRAELSDYAYRRQLAWIEDDSNSDERFDRNFLRLRILPLLKQRWPHFSRAVARSAQLCAEQEALLDELLEESLHHLTLPDGSLDLAPMMTMGSARRGALIRRWLAVAGVRMPSQDQLSRLWNEVVLSRPDAAAQLLLADRQIRRFRQRLFILPLQLPPLHEQVLEWPDNQTTLMLPQTLGMLRLAAQGQAVRAPTTGERVTVRFGAQGVLHIVGRQHGRSLKKIWQERDIAPWQRERTPLLYYNEQLIMAPGIFITREGQAREGETIWRVEWVSAVSADGQ